MNVIAKMNVSSIEDYGFSRKINFRCVYDSNVNTGDDPENKSFTKATPSGEAWMTVDNKAVWPAFQLPGGEAGNWKEASQHYVIFVDAKKHSLADVHRALAALEAPE